MDAGQLIERFDPWLKDDSPVAALVMRQWLVPVEGKDAVIFPPTYPIEGKPTGYNIDYLKDGPSVCQIDSVGAQANRMEPIFKRDRYSKLVPQLIIEAGDKKVNLLDAGHRAADAIVRFSALAPKLEDAFRKLQAGDAEPLARLAPTSLVFGAWDSRSTQAKAPRIVRSVIRAFGVAELHRSAQYIPPVDYVGEDLLSKAEGAKATDALSEQGFLHNPKGAWTHGGVSIHGELRRDAILNLVAVRALGVASDGKGGNELRLRRYILALSLVALTAPPGGFLRQDCLVVPDPDRPAQWQLVGHDGKRDSNVAYSHSDVLSFAEAVANAFGV
ncbi:MAG TPA: type I-U CRISPR-associated RAMP protein Csb1/Cas7u, partial [Burkholderiales bacterium]|nr:type I-U CRISPR-associated RAMP protein Csb1/Cas7u [Burkholderiales bacterium]